MRYGLAALFSVCLAAAASAQIDPKTAMLEQAGFEALNAGQPARAAAVFRQALAVDPKNAQLHYGAGVAAWLERRHHDARAAFERALSLNPKHSQARLFLGQVEYRLGDLPAAIAAYEALASDTSQPDEIAATVARWRRELDLHHNMQRTVGELFTVSYEGPPQADLAGKALESLNRAYWRVGQLLGIYPASPVAVVLYTTEQFRDITRSPVWAAAAFDGIIRVPMRGALDKGEELDRVLAHEFAHVLIRTMTSRPIPTWLNEGLAAAVETGDISWAAARIRHAPRPMPLAALAGSFSRLSGSEAELAYASSAMAVRRLLDTAGGIAVANLLRDLGEGADLERAFARRMPWTLPDFGATLGQPIP